MLPSAFCGVPRKFARRYHCQFSLSTERRDQPWIGTRLRLLRCGRRVGTNELLPYAFAFALAYAGLAEAYDLIGYWGFLPPKEAFPEAKRAAQKALDLDSDLAEAHTALAYTQFQYEWKFKEAEREFREAIRLDPSSADARLGLWEYPSDFGQVREAHEQLEHARELDPLSVRISFNFAAKILFRARF
jgi:tetratricopeptide (TPR) repeat protein